MGPALLLWVAGCGSGSDGRTVVPPVQVFLSAPDQTLPIGLVGEPYEARLEVSGGDEPYTWRIADAGAILPGGIGLRSDGTIQGVPTEAGTFVFAVEAVDAVNRTKRSLVTLPIVLEPDLVRCGETIGGRFGGNGFGVDGPDLNDSGDLAWLAVELPDDATTRVELVFDNDAVSTLYVERPSELVGSWDIDEHYVGTYLNPAYTDMTVAIDAGTNPSLSGYETQPLLPLLLVGQSVGDWSLEVVCTDGPIFSDLLKYPVELGLALDWDFDVYGDNTGVRIFTEDPLPDWMIWDESTGRVTGTAMERGGWEFTLVAEGADGRRREEAAILGVFDVLPIACGETVPFETEEGYFDGEAYAYYDPKGYRVFRLPLDGVAASSVELSVTGSDGHYLGLSMPGEEDLKFYGGAERFYLPEPTVGIALDPRTYPAVGHYLDAGGLYVSAGTIGTIPSMSLTATCPDAPRPDLAALPVVETFTPSDFALTALGGTPPYTWEATGLPAGITLGRDGALTGSTGSVGSHPVEITVTDRFGAGTTESHVLHVGAAAACEGYTVLACGDSVGGTFTDTYYTDGNAPASTEVFCVIDRGEALGFEIYSDQGEIRVDLADPGRSAEELFGPALGTYVAYVDRDSSEGVAVDPFSWPDGDDYLDLPVVLAIRAYVPGDWTVHLVCD